MRWTLSVVLLCAACGASARQGPLQAPAQAPARIDATPSYYDIQVSRSDHPIGQAYGAPPDRVWPVALAAYAAAGLRVDGSSAAQRQVQTQGQVLRRSLKGVALSSYFDCGHELSGSIADSWRLKIDARMAVGSGGSRDSSIVQTLVSVSASPVEGTSTELRGCASKGALEARIAQAIGQALARQ